MADGLFGSIASGAASGAGQGATLGSIIPGVGTAAGAIGGAIIGGAMGGAKQQRANQAQNIPLVDPMERARLAQLEQTRKAISSGTDVMTQQAIQQQQNVGKAAQSALARSTGGDVGSTVDALLKAQKATQGGINQAMAQNAQRLPYFQSAEGDLLSRIAQRKLELGLLNRAQKTAEAAQAQTNANINAQALLATQGGVQTIPQGFSQAGQQLQPLVQGVQQGIQGVKNLFSNANSVQSTVQNQIPLPPTQPNISTSVQPESFTPQQTMMFSQNPTPATIQQPSGLGNVQSAPFLGEGQVTGVQSQIPIY